MTNVDRFKQHALRTLLLEGQDSNKILNKVKAFNSGDKSDADREELAGFLRKHITATVKDLVSEDQLTDFIDDLGK